MSSPLLRPIAIAPIGRADPALVALLRGAIEEAFARQVDTPREWIRAPCVPAGLARAVEVPQRVGKRAPMYE